MALPSVPDLETREQLLDVLAELVARGGCERLLRPPVEPGEEAFPDRWAPSCAGAARLLRRLGAHAGLDRQIVIDDVRAGQPVTERRPATRLELVELRPGTARYALGFIGEDDVVGTFAHEVGVSFAVLHRPDRADPYRTAEPPVLVVDPDLDLTRGSIATVYLSGLYGSAYYLGIAEYISPGLLAWFLLFQALAGLMYGALFAAIGAACSDMKETQNLLWPVMLLATLPMFLQRAAPR